MQQSSLQAEAAKAGFLSGTESADAPVHKEFPVPQILRQVACFRSFSARSVKTAGGSH